MKGYAAFLGMAVMSLALLFMLVSRERPVHQAPAVTVEVAASDVDASVPDAGDVPPAPADMDAGTDAGGPGRRLRVTTLGWELAAPGAALSSAGGDDEGRTFELAPETSLDATEARLARGGADPRGADVAILPLPSFVVSFERLRALEPRAFLVVGYSRGREEFRASAGALTKTPGADDEVRLVAFGPTTSTETSARAQGSESATVLGLFALDLLGVALPRVRFVAPDTAEAKGAPFAALVKGASDERARAFSTADASRFVPIVAVAPKAILDGHEATLRAWSKAWFDGLARAKEDVPGIARRLAAKEDVPLSEGVGAAPQALELVERLGQIESVGLPAQTSLMGSRAKGPARLEVLMLRTWQLARAASMVSSAAPEPLPIDSRMLTTAPPPKDAPSVVAEAEDAGVRFGAAPVGAVVQLVYRSTSDDVESIGTQIALLAAIFERGIFRISARGGADAARLVAESARGKGVAPERLVPVAHEPSSNFASVDVLSPP